PGHHRDLHSFPTRRSSDLEETGPGIKLTVRPINQALIPGDSPQTVSPITLKRLINELNMYGAKHISIDGERLVNTTVIRDINGEDRKSTRLNSSHVKISYA